MVNYQNGKIYKIVNDVDDQIYVGSTTQKLYKRIDGHKQKAKKPNHEGSKLLDLMSELGPDHFKIILLEEYPCQNSEQLRAKEDFWMRKLNASLNINNAVHNAEEYNAIHKERDAKVYKEWATRNKEARSIYMKDYRKSYDKEKKRVQDKLYREQNKEKIAEMKRKWYEEHKDEVNAKRREQKTL